MAGRIAYYGNIVKDGLILNLDAAKKDSYPGSGTTWRDIASNTITGSLINGPTFDSGNGGSIVFDGVNDYASVSNQVLSSLNDDNSLTVSIFVNINEDSLAIRSGLVCNQKYQTETDAGGFGLVIESSPSRFGVNLTKEIGGVKTSYESIALSSINRKQYAQYCFTYNSISKTIITYKNGVQQSTSTNANYAWTKNTTNQPTLIGTNTQGGWGNYYKMNIGTTQIYNRALTAQEVLQNYNATKGRYGL